MNLVCWNEKQAWWRDVCQEFSWLTILQKEDCLALFCKERTGLKPEVLLVYPGRPQKAWGYWFAAFEESWCRLEEAVVQEWLARQKIQMRIQKEHILLQPVATGQPVFKIFHNGVSTQGRVLLEQGDWILLQGEVFVVLGLQLLAAGNRWPCAFWERPVKPAAFKTDIRQNPGLKAFEKEGPVHLEVDLPSPISQTEPPHWFQAVGPAGMILISALASAGSLYLQNPQNPGLAITSAMTSLSLAGAFLGFGLISRHLSIQAARKPQDRQEELYTRYLKQIQEKMETIRLLERQKMDHQKQKLLGWDESLHLLTGPWKIPVAITRTPAFWLDIPAIRYDQKEDPQIVQLEKLKECPCQKDSWVFLEENGQYELPLSLEEIRRLFGLWCWMAFQENTRWIWMDMSDACLDQIPFGKSHPAVWLEETFLSLKTMEELAELRRRFPGIRFTIWNASALEQIPVVDNTTWLCARPAAGAHSLEGIFWLPAVQKEKLRAWNPAQNRLVERNPLALELDKSLEELRQQEACLQVRLNASTSWDLDQDGPHVLCAGTTGSGKSEGLLYILLWLCLHNTSRQLQLLVVDFKGGALGQVFGSFPHLAGSLTNLESSSFARLEQALNRELETRQKKLQAFVNEYPFETPDLAAYNRYFPQDPISHLVLVIDEFAEFKRILPEAMHYLQEAARIGRSLGLHLILATQKPAGVVDEQILANTRSRLCFMVHAASESREVLGHEKASQLNRPGQFCLQIAGRQEFEGQMSCCRDSAQGQVQVTWLEKGVIRQQTSEPMSLLEKATAWIGNAKEERRWILHPDLLACSFDKAILQKDCIDHVQTMGLEPGQPCWIQAPRPILEKAARILAAGSTKPVICCPGGVDERFYGLQARELWQLENQKVRLLLFADDVDLEKLAWLLKDPFLEVIVLSSGSLVRRMTLLELCALRLGTQLKDREEEYLLFGQPAPQRVRFPLFLGHQQGEMFVCAMPSQSLEQQPKPAAAFWSMPLTLQQVLKLPGCLLGFCTDTLKPVYVPQSRPLILAWTASGCKESIQKLAGVWKLKNPALRVAGFDVCEQEADVFLLELPSMQPVLSTSWGSARLYESALCFVGPGLRDYQYGLKCPSFLPAQGNGVLFHPHPQELEMLELRPQ